MTADLNLATVTLERDGHVLLMGLNRPEKRNAFNTVMLADLSRAYALLEADGDLRVGVLFAHGEHFTAGLDLIDVAPKIAGGASVYPEGGRDPWRLDGTWTKPIVAATQGRCLTLGIELLLAADIRLAAEDARFAQIEIRRGIFPFGTCRAASPCGGACLGCCGVTRWPWFCSVGSADALSCGCRRSPLSTTARCWACCDQSGTAGIRCWRMAEVVRGWRSVTHPRRV